MNDDGELTNPKHKNAAVDWSRSKYCYTNSGHRFVTGFDINGKKLRGTTGKGGKHVRNFRQEEAGTEQQAEAVAKFMLYDDSADDRARIVSVSGKAYMEKLKEMRG